METQGRSLRVIGDLQELLRTLNQPPAGIEPLKINGSFILAVDRALVSCYHGILAVTRNPSNPNWCSVEKFIEDRNKQMPEFAANFYRMDEWTHVPYDPFAAFATNYIKAQVHLGTEDSTSMAEARLSLGQ